MMNRHTHIKQRNAIIANADTNLICIQLMCAYNIFKRERSIDPESKCDALKVKEAPARFG